jgi:hypothetical protein
MKNFVEDSLCRGFDEHGSGYMDKKLYSDDLFVFL